MPRPKRTKILSTADAVTRKAVPSHVASSRTRQARDQLKTHANGEQHSAVNEKNARAKSRTQHAVDKDALSASSNDTAAPLVTSSPQSTHRPPLQDISKLQRSPFIGRNANRSPWADPKKAPMQLDNGFEEYLQSSSPQLPPTTISRPPSAMKAQGTPSFLSIANFKRRPRQPSILRMVQQDTTEVNANDDDDQDLTLGSLGRSSPPRPSVSPVHLGSETAASSGTKRKAATLDSDNEPIADGDQNIENANEVVESDDLPERSTLDLRKSLATSPRPSSAATEANPKPFKKTPPPRHRGRRVKQKQSSTVIVPSSSPPNSASSPHSTSSLDQNQPKAKPAPKAATQQQRMSKRRKVEKPSLDSQTVTTASLKEFLPKGRTRAARQKQNGFFDDPGSQDDDADEMEEEGAVVSEDEDGESEEYGRSKPKRDQTKRRGSYKTKTAAVQTDHSRGTITRAAKTKAKGAAKTYGRQSEITGSDKENDEGESFFDAPDDDEDEDTLDSTIDADTAAVKDTLKKSKELAEAKKKFQEVDDWELSFESCDVNGGSSSPWR